MSERSLVRAAGGVLWRRVDGAVQVALVHRPKYDDWSLPKGKLDPGEPAVVGGLREVCEETGFGAVVGRTLGVSRYRVLEKEREADKLVRWWAMRATEGAFVPGKEVDALRWLPVRSALARVSSGYDCAPLTAFASGCPETTTVLLVRHGSAGDREGWEGPDDRRPLDPTGREQAAALAAVLPVYGPARVLSAPLVRCVETVRPLADHLRLRIEEEPAAAERENVCGAKPLQDALRNLGAAGRHVVVCSQGGAIPDAVAALTGTQAVPVRKGSVWALSFAGEQVVDADHASRPDC